MFQPYNGTMVGYCLSCNGSGDPSVEKLLAKKMLLTVPSFVTRVYCTPPTVGRSYSTLTEKASGSSLVPGIQQMVCVGGFFGDLLFVLADKGV